MLKTWMQPVARSGNAAVKAAAAAFRFVAIMACMPADRSSVLILVHPELTRRHWRHRERLRCIAPRPMQSRY
jgi:hypothetical protein